MKVGIITFHRALNYGAVLQAFALQSYLTNIGIESKLIDYRCGFVEEFYKPLKSNPIREPKNFMREVAYLKGNAEKRKKFEQFIDTYMDITDPIFTHEQLEALNDDFDLFITGSDQVWNDRWSGFDKAYFLDFAYKEKRYSYAASFGFNDVPDALRMDYSSLLHDFQGISVREKSGRDIVEGLLNREATVSIDPTLLLTRNDWDTVANKPSEFGYVLVYTLENSSSLENLAHDIAQKNNTKIIRIVDTIHNLGDYECRGFLSPNEFVGLFANAGFVVTNSFHGLMFSCIFEKPFWVAYQERAGAPNSRLIDFIADNGFENRVVKKSVLNLDTQIDFTKSKAVIEQRREEAKTYFKSICEQREKYSIVPIRKEMCCGCRACEQICPQRAIKMEQDEEGFLYPVVDKSLCVRCGLCVKNCGFLKDAKIDANPPLDTVLAKHKDETTRMKSRSGGVFVAVSNRIIEVGGAVYGVALDEHFQAKHLRALTKEDRDSFCGSKYVQSDTGYVYSEVLEDLKKKRFVLFSGTACQIAGLYSFLRKNNITIPNELLATCDIVCHGVMSPLIWNDNLAEIKHKNPGTIRKVEFRDKKYGWNSHIETYDFGNTVVKSEQYTSVFYEHVALRPSCYVCPYASTSRISDLTLADAWGVNTAAPDWNDNKGVSFIMLNSDKGRKLFYDSTGDDLEYSNVDLQRMLQPNMQNPTPKPLWRDEFWKEYSMHGYNAVADICEKKQMAIKRKNKAKGDIVRILRIMNIRK